ncbi:MAG: dihydropteroate synthase [Pseudomonadota bacterium]
MNTLICGSRSLSLQTPVVMGILNITPDSFSDGGRYTRLDAALRHAEQMLSDGAAIIDVGAESTRPGAAVVGVAEELDRLLPVVEAIASRLDVIISIDTSTPEAMTAAAAAGAGLINDVRALRRPGALTAAAATGLPICLMHMQGEPTDMQAAPHYRQVVSDVCAFLSERIQACEAAGIPRSKLIGDPGFGFGKSLQHNLQLLRHFDDLQSLALPLLVGVSRKSMLGQVLAGAAVNERQSAGLAAMLLAVERGARIVRSHDVRPTADALALWQAQENHKQESA